MKAHKLHILIMTTIIMVVATMFVASCEIRPASREHLADTVQVDLVAEPDSFKLNSGTVLVELHYSNSQKTG